MGYGILGEFEKLGTPDRIEIEAIKNKTEVRFLFSFGALHQPVEIVMPASFAMKLMQGLQNFQATHKLPIPRRPLAAGRPKLRLVRKDDL